MTDPHEPLCEGDAAGPQVRPARRAARARFGKLVGASRPMRRIFKTLEPAAPSDATVLLIGETGTGKELAAESIHEASARSDGPFVVVDCGATAAHLLESELFGHQRGAFTSADRPRTGAFAMAHGGTIFIDGFRPIPIFPSTPLGCACRLEPSCQAAVKHPIVRGWQRSRADERTVRAPWNAWPTANVPLVTGGPGRLVVLDIDGRRRSAVAPGA